VKAPIAGSDSSDNLLLVGWWWSHLACLLFLAFFCDGNDLFGEAVFGKRQRSVVGCGL
jgi:hypothetical protein